jgi:curved DNA-binding protein CbpA
VINPCHRQGWTGIKNQTLPLADLPMIAQQALYDACRTLFGSEVNPGPEFLAYLQPSGAKVAFRNQVKEHHPDRFAGAPHEVRAQQTERFREIHQAYTLLSDFLTRRHRSHARPATRPAAAQRPARPVRSWPAGAEHAPTIPPLALEFGIFAYYLGKVDYRDLIDALVWQRRQRPAIGTIACQWGWLSEAKVRGILNHRGSPCRFGRKAMELGLLSSLQVEALLRHQRSLQQRLGQYFIERDLLTSAEADQLVRELERHNLLFARKP